MAIDYLEELESDIERGLVVYSCQSKLQNEWYVSEDIDELRGKAKRTANARKYEVPIYRLINRVDVTSDDFYLIVRKILDPGPRGEPRLHWSMVETKEAAELMRDVSHGPTPYYGAMIEEVIMPDSKEE